MCVIVKTVCFCGDIFKEVRCHVLPLIPHGRYTCSQGFMVDSRCDFTCVDGYRIEGEHSRTCQHQGSWSGGQPVCSGTYWCSMFFFLDPSQAKQMFDISLVPDFLNFSSSELENLKYSPLGVVSESNRLKNNCTSYIVTV